MVFVEEVAVPVTATSVAAVVSWTAWSLVEAALLAADRPVTAELPETVARLVEVPLVYL